MGVFGMSVFGECVRGGVSEYDDECVNTEGRRERKSAGLDVHSGEAGGVWFECNREGKQWTGIAYSNLKTLEIRKVEGVDDSRCPPRVTSEWIEILIHLQHTLQGNPIPAHCNLAIVTETVMHGHI